MTPAMPPNQRERDQEKRRQKLADIDEQIKTGRLTVRQMSEEELERHRKERELRAEARPRR